MIACDEAQHVAALVPGAKGSECGGSPHLSQPLVPQRVFQVDPLLLPIMDGYLRGRSRDLARMEQALTAGDWSTIRTLGHSMRGSGTSYGLPPISAFGDALERAADAEDHATVECQLTALAAFLTQVRVQADER